MEMNFRNISRIMHERLKLKSDMCSVDLPDIENMDAFSSVYLSCCFADILKKAVSFGYSFPASPAFSRIFLDEMKNEISLMKLGESVKTPTKTSLNDFEDAFQKIILTNGIMVDLPDVKEYASEIIHNVQSHAVEPFMLAQCDYSKEKGYFDIAIGDIGLGIKGTLQKKNEYSYLKSQNHAEAIRKAFEEGVTSKTEARGTGLPMVADYFREEKKGILYITSGNGYYMVGYDNGDFFEEYGNLEYNLNGVQIMLRFKCQ